MPADRTSTEGQVVYRRVAPPREPQRRRRESRFDPALLPLLFGFAILMVLILALGNLSIRRLEDTSQHSLRLEQSYAARASVLLQFRVALTRLDNEARDRAAADARRELRPPFDLRLNTALGKVLEVQPLLDHAPLSELPKWQRFHSDLDTYLDTVRDRERYAREGFSRFRDVDFALNDLIEESRGEEPEIANQAEVLQDAARRSIRIWNIVALITGILIAAGT